MDLGITHPEPMSFYCDNKDAIHIGENLIFLEHTKHIELDCHFVHEKIASKLISP